MKALLLICHGTRLRKGQKEAEEFVNQCLDSVSVPIKEVCFLELAEPSISQGFETCIQKGATSIFVVPVFLLSANHVKIDIPKILGHLMNQYPETEVTFGRELGVHDALSHLLWEKIRNQVALLNKNSNVLLVGRGSSDPDVKRDLTQIASNFQHHYGIPNIQTCFLTGSSPSFEEALWSCKDSYDQVVIVPYLLFSGLLINGMKLTVNRYKEDTQQDVILCETLGYHPILREVLLTRINETLGTRELEYL
ncbi:sirohydrochlorin chelatase [Fictibacillus phosphorivorans]|uniref:sirohydrochlorin chelatase n=1 Tax=Fictibacillus phosphorivorans TaxID=1221500 RepID=UPI00203F0C3A|nr:sirohydrochlorin chelatase [Fictibacillus phosphorivorans]MCM3718842.1 sirohydrochlorin chelatase [Fictibacillus phosphorivorans]MCM3776464.1 sirohydrochlorin chelatase [Fictibacillus phosphorivorans]